jgi:hypothetical protein
VIGIGSYSFELIKVKTPPDQMREERFIGSEAAFMSAFLQKRGGEGLIRRGIIVFIDYQSVCPFVGTGSPSPSPRKGVWTQREGSTLAYGLGSGGGANSDDWKKSLALCILYGLSQFQRHQEGLVFFTYSRSMALSHT